MRGKRFLTLVLVAAAVAALGGILVAVAGADDTTTLPDISAPELIARMGDHSQAPAAISGDISWTNELFGELPFMPDHVAQPAESPLMASGSGRLWAQDGKLRLESQGQGGDQVLVADAEAGTVWTYTFVDDTARLYEWAGDGREGGRVAGGRDARRRPDHARRDDARACERLPPGGGAVHEGRGERPDVRRRPRRLRPDDDARRLRHGAR